MQFFPIYGAVAVAIAVVVYVFVQLLLFSSLHLRKENCIHASWNGLTFVYFTANYDGKQFMKLG